MLARARSLDFGNADDRKLPTAFGGRKESAINRNVYIPLTTGFQWFDNPVATLRGDRRTEVVELGKSRLHEVRLIVSDINQVPETASAVEHVLKSHHPIKDWEVKLSPSF